MLTELVVLSILWNEEFSIYGLKKRIDEEYSLFLSSSMGAIHPTLKKLYSNKHIEVKKSKSEGGQRRSCYYITPAGKKYFEEIMLHSKLTDQIVNIKIMALPKIEKKLQIAIIKNIKEFFEGKLLDCENFYEKNNSEYVKFCMEKIKQDINWLKQTESALSRN